MATAHTYSVVLSPTSAAAGARVEFKATFTNKASDVKLGSANLTAPTGFSVVSASVPVGSATTSGNVVQLRNLFIQPGKSVTATVVADVPCTTGDKTWSVVARKTGDFSGADSGPRVNSQLTTTVTGSCATALRVVNQPANARINETITTSRYNTPPGAAVTVEVVDGAGHRVTTSSAVITVGIAPGTGNGTLHGTTTATAVNGLATFSDLSIDLEGTSYALRASSSGLGSATSSTFRIDETATVCTEDVNCNATLENADASLDVTAQSNGGQGDAGVLTINRTQGAALDCAGYDELLDRDFTVDFVPNAGSVGRAKTVALTISRDAMKDSTDNGVAHLEMCFGAPFMFTVKPGTPPLQNPAPGLFVGLLPDCGTPPCVSKRKGQGGAGIIVAKAPGGDQDPRYNG